MRAREFVFETVGKISHRAEQASVGLHKVRDSGGYDRLYMLNRLGMAMAMADGKDKKSVDMDEASWAEKFNTVHPYTEAEHNMLHQAMGAIPHEHQEVVPLSKSEEPKAVNVESPVKPFKGY